MVTDANAIQGYCQAMPNNAKGSLETLKGQTNFEKTQTVPLKPISKASEAYERQLKTRLRH